MFAGYAAYAASAEAEPIHTDEAGLVVEQVTVPSAGADLPLYVARPAGTGRHPTVMVINEIFGVHEWIRDVCRRLAH
ncbi:dienelactone hydrolase family protein, partial [Salmonella enterica subsp. enterica serovar 1,4,[5],12:i:-]